MRKRWLGIVSVALFALAGAAPAAAKVSVQEQSFSMTDANAKPRLEAHCPGNRRRVIPLGGGMYSTPVPDADGEGIYPHSFERLGAQGGFHVTPVFYDPSSGSQTPRQVTMQVICGPKTRTTYPYRRTVYVQPGEDKSASVSCPGKRRLFGGGFQRTNFVSRGGNYITSSRATSDKTWTVSGSAFGNFGGELTAIVYCRQSGKPIVQEVTASASVASGEYGAATTPPCPGNTVVIGGGHSVFPATSSLFADGYVNASGTWTVGVYNAFGPAATVTAHAYCHSPNFPRARKGEPKEHISVVAPSILQRAEKAAISVRVAAGGCYPSPAEVAKGITERSGIKTSTARNQSGVNRSGVVYVLINGASCDVNRMSARVNGKVYTINSATGAVKGG
jgi:hypothetical protein